MSCRRDKRVGRRERTQGQIGAVTAGASVANANIGGVNQAFVQGEIGNAESAENVDVVSITNGEVLAESNAVAGGLIVGGVVSL